MVQASGSKQDKLVVVTLERSRCCETANAQVAAAPDATMSMRLTCVCTLQLLQVLVRSLHTGARTEEGRQLQYK